MVASAAPIELDSPPNRVRLVGVDAARGVALLGMAAVHVFPAEVDDGSTSTAYLVASGRSAALFAVLAGVGIALASGGRRPLRGQARVRWSAALVVRGLLIGAIGLLLPLLESGAAVILAYYAALFIVAVPLLGLGSRRLAAIGLAVAVVAPFVSSAVREGLPRGSTANVTFATLFGEPVGLLQTLVLTGYYPVLGWTAYLCAGLAVGRLDLSSRRVAVGLLAGGATLAVGASAVSSLLLGPLGGLDRIAEVTDLPQGADVADVVARSRFGTVPTTTYWWLATDAPHSTTPLDLLHTTGTALAVIGAALLLAVFSGATARRLLVPLAAAGSMPLTLYCLHLVVLGTVHLEVLGTVPAGDPLLSWTAQAVAALVLATAWRARLGRGPLEAAIAAVTRAVARRPPAATTQAAPT